MKSRHLDWHRENGPFHGKVVVRTNRSSEGQREPPLLAGQSGGSASLIRCGPLSGANDRPHCSIGREFTVISPELLRPAGWGCLRRAWPAGMPGAPGRSVGTATNLHDALAIHRGEH